MFNRFLYFFLFALCSLSACNTSAQDITLVANGRSEYKIIVPAGASKLEQRSATTLQSYIQKSTGALLQVVTEGGKVTGPAIYIGHTAKEEKVHTQKLAPEAYRVQAVGQDIVFCGGSGKGLIYGVYHFLEKYLHIKKLSGEPAIVPISASIAIPGSLKDDYQQHFVYREAYYPASHDAEYLEWRQLHNLEDLWGLWGHSYNKLVPAATYFKSNPEYFAQVKGVRQASQLCLSNEGVYKIVVAELKKRIAANPDAMYWSISPNDDNGYCQCDKCLATDNEQGSPAGSLIKFVNRVASVFPNATFTTLAYGYTHKAPRSLRPAKNVYVFLSNIDAYRDRPLAEEGSAASFRSDLKSWGALTPNIFVWDYITQFTNYLAPFPNLHTLQPNMQYLKENGVKGVFAQGSGDTYGEWAELRSYITARLLEDEKADIRALISEFLKDYYGNAATHLQEYISLLQDKMLASRRKLDIYGSPVNEWNKYLSPEMLDQFSTLMDKAEGAVEGKPVYQERVMRARLPLEYTVLQQARLFGVEKHGFWVKDKVEGWTLKPKFADKLARFVANCKRAGVTELSEGGLTPDQYMEEWNAIIRAGVTPTKAIGGSVTLQYPFAEDYPAKGNRTLIDGNPGYTDFSYNWLCFYGTPMVATIDLGKPQNIKQISMNFLNDVRHWIFIPEKVTIELSDDGVNYKVIQSPVLPPNEATEQMKVSIIKAAVSVKATTARYIRVTVANMAALPAWRQRENKKPMIACDEIYVQ